MAPQEFAALAARVDDLDRDTARRVARLVVECRANLPLALQAVEDADQGHSVPPAPGALGHVRRVLAYFGSTRATL